MYTSISFIKCIIIYTIFDKFTYYSYSNYILPNVFTSF